MDIKQTQLPSDFSSSAPIPTHQLHNRKRSSWPFLLRPSPRFGSSDHTSAHTYDPSQQLRSLYRSRCRCGHERLPGIPCPPSWCLCFSHSPHCSLLSYSGPATFVFSAHHPLFFTPFLPGFPLPPPLNYVVFFSSVSSSSMAAPLRFSALSHSGSILDMHPPPQQLFLTAQGRAFHGQRPDLAQCLLCPGGSEPNRNRGRSVPRGLGLPSPSLTLFCASEGTTLPQQAKPTSSKPCRLPDRTRNHKAGVPWTVFKGMPSSLRGISEWRKS